MSWDDDRDVLRLEALLSVYRCRVPAPDFSALAQRRPRRRWLPAVAAAAVVAAILIGEALFFREQPGEWRATAIAGSTLLPDRPLRTGDVIRTSAASRIRLQSLAVGVIEVEGATTVRLIESHKGRQRIALDVGMIHARTTSPPGVFVVDTPQARAIDLGCEYVLSIGGGGGELRVTSGWVDLTHDFEQSLVPQGATVAIAPDGAITAPAFDDASAGFRHAVREFANTRDLASILSLARRRDAYTLLNLFRLARPDERLLIFDRLNQLVPAPASIQREAVREWRPEVTERWWRPVLAASGVRPIKKTRGMLDGL